MTTFTLFCILTVLSFQLITLRGDTFRRTCLMKLYKTLSQMKNSLSDYKMYGLACTFYIYIYYGCNIKSSECVSFKWAVSHKS